MTVDLPILIGVLVGAATLVGLIAKGYMKIRAWIAAVAVSSQAAADQLTPTAGTTTVAGLVERAADDIERINDRLDRQDKATRESRDLAQSAITVANSVGRRLDEHLIRDHGAKLAPLPEEN